MKARVHCVAVAEDYHHDLTPVDGVDSAIRRDPQCPDVSVAIELVDVKVYTRTTRFPLQQVERPIE
ncbi:MAG TPA: hypothetical protein VGG32_05435 [Thermoplasmata archaeon]